MVCSFEFLFMFMCAVELYSQEHKAVTCLKAILSVAGLDASRAPFQMCILSRPGIANATWLVRSGPDRRQPLGIEQALTPLPIGHPEGLQGIPLPTQMKVISQPMLDDCPQWLVSPSLVLFH
jgi:hypothetical protein